MPLLQPNGAWKRVSSIWPTSGDTPCCSAASQVIGTISDEGERREALPNLADTLAKHNEHERILKLVHRWWLQADTRDEAIELLPLAFGFIPRYPNIGRAFYDAFAWVDNFLSG
jgi:hypothetical protein